MIGLSKVCWLRWNQCADCGYMRCAEALSTFEVANFIRVKAKENNHLSEHHCLRVVIRRCRSVRALIRLIDCGNFQCCACVTLWQLVWLEVAVNADCIDIKYHFKVYWCELFTSYICKHMEPLDLRYCTRAVMLVVRQPQMSILNWCTDKRMIRNHE